MKTIFAVLAVALSSQAALAADIYVREAKGVDMTATDTSQITEAVKNAIRGMPEHNLVFSETNADFVLQPSLVKKGSQNVLRLQAIQGADVLATNDQPMPAKPGGQQVTGATRFALSRLPPQLGQKPGAQAANQNATDSSNIGGRNIPVSPSDQGTGSAPDDTGSISGSTGGVSPDGASTESHQDESMSGGTSDSLDSSSAGTSAEDTMGTMGGESRGMAPQSMGGMGNRLGYFSLGAGPAVGVGMNSDNVLYGLNAAYNIDFNERVGGKVMGNLALGAGSDSSRLINIATGANIYLPEAAIARGRPYLTADLGWGNARRNDTEDTADGLAIGAGGGFQFAAQNLNLDIQLRYAIVTTQLRDNTPSVLGLNLAVNF